MSEAKGESAEVKKAKRVTASKKKSAAKISREKKRALAMKKASPVEQRKLSPSMKTWEKVKKQIAQEFGFTPDIEIVFSKEQLWFWHAGALCEEEDKTYIQLHPRFEKGSFLGYGLEELLLHEGAHSGRLAFEPSLYEEVLCYSLSPVRLRQWLGPYFSHPPYLKSFFTLIFLAMLFPWLAVFFSLPELFYGSLLALFTLLISFVHYFSHLLVFGKAFKKLEKLARSKKKARRWAFKISQEQAIEVAKGRLRRAQLLAIGD